MKALERLVYSVILVGGLWGWVLGVQTLLASPSSVVLSVPVTPSSYVKARERCGKYVEPRNYGKVSVPLEVGRSGTVLPCSVVMDGPLLEGGYAGGK